MRTHIIDGVRFEWTTLDQPEECMNVAKVLVEDACHTVAGELRICSVEQSGRVQWEWRLQIENGHRVEPGWRENRFGTDVKEFVQTAMQRAASEMADELRARQSRTREMLAKQDRQREFGQLVSEVLNEISP